MNFFSNLLHKNEEAKMPVYQKKLYTCWMCGASFEDPAEFLFHIRNCTKAKMQNGVEAQSVVVVQAQNS